MTRDFKLISEYTQDQLKIVKDFLDNELTAIQFTLNDERFTVQYGKLPLMVAMDTLLDLRDYVDDKIIKEN